MLVGREGGPGPLPASTRRARTASSAALDGKVPSAVDHPARQGDVRAKTGPSSRSASPSSTSSMFPKAASDPRLPEVADRRRAGGIKRIGFRFGFDDDALMQRDPDRRPQAAQAVPGAASISRASTPRSLMPLPEGRRLVPRALDRPQRPDRLDRAARAGRRGQGQGRRVRRVDPHAAARSTSARTSWAGSARGWSCSWRRTIRPRSAPARSSTRLAPGPQPPGELPTALAHLPKLTLVAEVPEPKAFARTLEGAINALNHQLAGADGGDRSRRRRRRRSSRVPAVPGRGRCRAGGGPGRAAEAAGGQRGDAQAVRPASPGAADSRLMPGHGRRRASRVHPPDAQPIRR